jgi:hypothetical protein
MRRADLADDPRFATAAARQVHFAELHRIVQTWIMTFCDIAALDAQLDEAKIALGEVRTLKKLSEMEWAEYWGAVQQVSDRNGGSYRVPGRPWRFSREELAPLGDPAFQGEHNRAVFAELGFSDEQIDGYIGSGALLSVSIPTTVTDHPRETQGRADLPHEDFVTRLRCRPPRGHQGCFEKLVSEPRKPKERAMTLSRDVIDGLPYVEGVLNHASPPIRIEPACGQQ